MGGSILHSLPLPALSGGSATPVATILAEKEVIAGYPGKPGLTPALYIMGVAILAFIAECVSWHDERRRGKYAPLEGMTTAGAYDVCGIRMFCACCVLRPCTMSG